MGHTRTHAHTSAHIRYPVAPFHSQGPSGLRGIRPCVWFAYPDLRISYATIIYIIILISRTGIEPGQVALLTYARAFTSQAPAR